VRQCCTAASVASAINPDPRHPLCGIDRFAAARIFFDLLVCGIRLSCYNEMTKGGELMKIKVNVRAGQLSKSR